MWRAPALAVLVLGLAQAAWGQEASSPSGGVTVIAVEFPGAEQTSRTYLRSVVRTAAGEPFDEAQAREDVDRLLKTGKFLTVTLETEATPDGVVVRFPLSERPVVQEIRFEGNVKFKEKKLLSSVPVSVGDPTDAYGVREGREVILGMYRKEAYGEAQVTIDEELLNRGILLYRIEEGPRVRVRKILFEGNDAIAPNKLQQQIQTQTYVWIFRPGLYDADQVESDATAVQSYYRDQGFLDARATWRVERSPDGEELTLWFTIVEGPRYTIESIAFEGNQVFTDEQVLAELTMAVGNPILKTELDRDAKRLQTLYGELGYIYAEVQAVQVFSATPNQVLVTVRILEGEQVRVGRIVVRGNERTQDKVVRRQLDLYPGDLFNLTEAKSAEQRLVQTQIFSRASVSPVGEEPGVRDIVVNVEEAAKAGDFLFGAGVTSDSGLVGSIMLDIKNFDVFDWPRSFREFIRLKSFHGAGQRLRIEAQPGTEFNRFRIDFTEPFLLDKPIQFGLGGYYFERERDSYDERRVGANMSFGRRLHWSFLEGWYGELAFRVENVNISDLHFFAPREVRDDKGDHLITSTKVSLVRDRTDSRFVPTKGDRFTLSYEQYGTFGGDFFGSLVSSYAWHKTLYTDVEDRKSVLTLRARGGAMFGDAPVFEKFYAGGIGSLRGFEFRGISPRRGYKDFAIGGNYMLMTGAEYSFPLFADVIRGVFFTDMGTVEEDFEITTWRASVGFGIRLQVDFFGPVPMEFDLAIPVSSHKDDEEQIFSFFIGTVF